jgi:hypothetical protein
MKRTTRKLVVRGETVRVLGALEMARVAGGDAQELGGRTGGTEGTQGQLLLLSGVALVAVPNP